MNSNTPISRKVSGLMRPEKVLWVFPQPTNRQEWYELIPSKSLRKQASQINALLSEAGIDFTAKPLTQELYDEWLPFYELCMKEQDHDVIAHADWLRNRIDSIAQAYVLEYKKNGEVVGGSIVSLNRDGIFTHHFKASKRIETLSRSNASLGSLMELKYLDFSFSIESEKITSGLSRNGFGYYNTIGYLVSKLKVGYKPEISAQNFDEFFHAKDPQTPTVWVAQEETGGILFLLSHELDYFDEVLQVNLQRANFTTRVI